jgi:hypothetical protein
MVAVGPFDGSSQHACSHGGTAGNSASRDPASCTEPGSGCTVYFYVDSGCIDSGSHVGGSKFHSR